MMAIVAKRIPQLGKVPPALPAGAAKLASFNSKLVDRVRNGGNVWELPGGRILLPRVFGFCRGVKHALIMLNEAVRSHSRDGKRLFLLGEIIHNPWVNSYFQDKGVRMLSPSQLVNLEQTVGPEDCAIVPAFGVLPDIQRRLEAIGCELIDTSCGDVRRLWQWAEQAARSGYAVLIFGRASHDETVVTKSRLSEASGNYIVLGNLEEADVFCRMIAGQADPHRFTEAFAQPATNARSIDPFFRLAQVSQTTMLFEETMRLREMLTEAYSGRFGPNDLRNYLLFHPTVCRATQDRQAAAVELCKSGCELVIVVGGFGSSNTRHLYELARQYAPAYFIEDSRSLLSPDRLNTVNLQTGEAVTAEGWLPRRRPLTLGVLAGASSPEVVVGEVLERLARYLSDPAS